MENDPQPPVGLYQEGSGDPWLIWVDTGGTFTDCLAVSHEGKVLRTKVLSSGRVRAVGLSSREPNTIHVDAPWDLPEGFFEGSGLWCLGRQDERVEVTGYRASDRAIVFGEGLGLAWVQGESIEIDTRVEAPILSAHWVTRTPLRRPLPRIAMRLATTRGTNALLERAGSRTALFITRGFGDLLEIGNQQRPDLFALNVVKVRPLYEEVVEVGERVDSTGAVLQPLRLESVRSAATDLLQRGISTAAVALMHSYRNPQHETALAGYLQDLGFSHVSCSAQLAPMIKIVPRAETAVVNAYLSGVIGEYLKAVGGAIGEGQLHALTSAGSLVRAAGYLPKDSLLSGPAGGVVGAEAVASQSGWPRSLAFDMGGTSTDVSRSDGGLDYRFETRVGDAHLLSPSLAIETVAAGGGSICYYDGLQLKVGPQSAGADPGPACYGAGGPLTLTDVNLLLGRLRPQSFEIPIQPAAAAEAADRLLSGLSGRGEDELPREQLLQGLLDIADERMAAAMRRISIRQGYRPSEYALVAFGGAGGQHACALAETLEMSTVLVPEDAGLLSAVGLGWAKIERIAEQQVLKPLAEVGHSVAEILDSLSLQATRAVLAEGVAAEEIEISSRLVYLRLQGQEASLAVSYRSGNSLEREFARLYEDHYGYRPEAARLEVEAIRVLASSVAGSPMKAVEFSETRSIESTESQSVYLMGRWRPVPVLKRQTLDPGDRFSGPTLVFENHCATVVHPGWRGKIDGYRCLVLQRVGSAEIESSRE